MSEILKKLFQPGRNVSVHELYKPTKREERRYAQWIVSKRYTVLNDMIRQASRAAAISTDYSGFVRFYKHQTSSCVSIHAGTEISGADLLPLTRWYAERICAFGYRLVNQDRLIREVSGYVQKRTRFYLKPPISLSLPADQLYGNIILELVAEDNRDVYAKCTVTSYNDRNYKPAGDFEDLLFKLLES